MGRGVMSPYGHIIAKPETWVNILSEISPGKLCKVSESVPPSPRKKHPASPMCSFPLAMRKQAWLHGVDPESQHRGPNCRSNRFASFAAAGTESGGKRYGIACICHFERYVLLFLLFRRHAKGIRRAALRFCRIIWRFFACLILLLMPDKASDTFNSAAYNREVSELRQQVKDLQKRITELEHSAAPAGQLKATVHAEQAKDEPITEISKPVRFPTRTSDTVICPSCGKRQQGNRNSCYACGLSFHYEDEQKS